MGRSQYTYKETPVELGTKHIRLLYLQPAQDRRDPLRCRLEVVSLEDPPKYFTLSYCWGKRREVRPLGIEDQYLSVSDSVDDALRSVRALDVRRIWVDQICINQKDLSERNDQILLMKDIYSASRECFVYLGKGTGKEHAQECEQLKQYIRVYGGRTKYMGLAGWWKIANGAFSPVTKKDQDSAPVYQETPWQRCMRDIISQSYFSRSWVIQELRLSRVVTCLWGTCTLNWDLVRACAKEIPIREGLSANSAFQQMHHSIAWASNRSSLNFLELDTQTSPHTKKLAKALHRFNRFVELLESFSESSHMPLFAILVSSRSLQATDEHDKVFAFVGLAHDRDDFPPPNYN